MKIIAAFLAFMILGCQQAKESESSEPQLKALIIDGQSNHFVWPKTTQMLKYYLEETQLFEVDIARTANVWLGIQYSPNPALDIDHYYTNFPLNNAGEISILDEPQTDIDFSPDFQSYDIMVLNVGETVAYWPESTQTNFENFMEDGGGLVVVHASNNAWPEWEAFNTMIGLGGWAGRDSISGSYVYYDNKGTLQHDTTAGPCGSHGLEQKFLVTMRDTLHPITKGLPSSWLHNQDELYERLRGPAKNMTVLATAYSDVIENTPPWNPTLPGTGRHEPMLMTIDYGKGRVFHTALGHWDYSMESVGFIATLQRGAEWAATGEVTLGVPDDFPAESKISVRSWDLEYPEQ